MKRVLILGSTGTIGRNTLTVIERFPDLFEVAGLSAHQNVELLARQTRTFRPDYVGIHADRHDEFQSRVGDCAVRIYDAGRDLAELCSLDDIDIVVIGMSGGAALAPFLAAVKSGKIVAPANKEALVMAGEILMAEAQRSGAVIVPVDSEQSAIFQCLGGQRREDLKKVYLTASGGTLKNIAKERFDTLTVDEILAHPRWTMGPKITVDSATMMNKGFEVIEAQRLFALTADQIEVLIHPEAIVHSLVGFRDGSVIAQLGITDMQIPIQYALTYPRRLPSPLPDLDLTRIGCFHFETPDAQKFPALQLAFEVARQGGTMPTVFNAADEVAVEAFLSRRILFSRIYGIVETVVQRHQRQEIQQDLGCVWEADQWARQMAAQEIQKLRM